MLFNFLVNIFFKKKNINVFCSFLHLISDERAPSEISREVVCKIHGILVMVKKNIHECFPPHLGRWKCPFFSVLLFVGLMNAFGNKFINGGASGSSEVAQVHNCYGFLGQLDFHFMKSYFSCSCAHLCACVVDIRFIFSSFFYSVEKIKHGFETS